MPIRWLVIFLMFFLYNFSVFAENKDFIKIAKERAEWTDKHFVSQRSPIPDGGVVVMPEKQMSQYENFKSQRNKEKSDLKMYGYIQEILPQTQSLINFKEIVKYQASKNDPNGLKHSISDIQMAYQFYGVPADSVDTMLGVAPSVTYVKDQGWAGVIQYFEKYELGICSYRENNLKFSHGSAIIPEEDVTRDVNEKITVAVVTGKQGYGFMYSVDWYTNDYFRELKCANDKYSPLLLSATLDLARVIDSMN